MTERSFIYIYRPIFYKKKKRQQYHKKSRKPKVELRVEDAPSGVIEFGTRTTWPYGYF